MKKTLYADDIPIITTNKTLHKAKKHLERGLKHIKEWTGTWDFKIN